MKRSKSGLRVGFSTDLKAHVKKYDDTIISMRDYVEYRYTDRAKVYKEIKDVPYLVSLFNKATDAFHKLKALGYNLGRRLFDCPSDTVGWNDDDLVQDVGWIKTETEKIEIKFIESCSIEEIDFILADLFLPDEILSWIKTNWVVEERFTPKGNLFNRAVIEKIKNKK